NTVFVDLRDPRELEREGRIPGSLHAPRGMLEFWIDPESPYHKPVFSSGKTFVFYCAAGWRSSLATKTAQDMGLVPVKHIEGGFSAWKEAGLPVEDYVYRHKARRKPRPFQETSANCGSVRNATIDCATPASARMRRWPRPGAQRSCTWPPARASDSASAAGTSLSSGAWMTSAGSGRSAS